MTSKAQYIDFINQGIVDTDGQPLSGGKVYTYTAGTVSAKTTYTDRNKTTLAANPIILDAYGRAEVYGDGLYKFVVKDSADVTQWDIDNVEIQSGADFLTADSPELDTALDRDLLNEAIVNGNFDLWQSATSFTNPATTEETANRWVVSKANGSGTAPNVNVARSTSTPDAKSKYTAKISPTTTGTIGASMEWALTNSLDSNDWEKFIGATISYSFYANVTNGVNFAVTIYDGVSSQKKACVGTGAWTLYEEEAVVLSGSTTGVMFKIIIADSVFAATVGDYYFSQIQVNQGSTVNIFYPRFYNQELLLDNPQAANLDIITNGTFETSADGWTTYADAAGATPVNGTGGSPTTTFARTTSSPVFNTGSGLLTKDASNRQGEGVSFDFTLPLGMVSRSMTIELWTITGGTYVTDDLRVYIYDITNTTLITPSVVAISSGTNRFLATFTTTTSTSYRLIIHVASTSANAYTCKIDNVSISATIEPVDSIGTVQLTSANGNISTSFTKTADHKFLRFSFSGSGTAGGAYQVVLAIGGNTKMTWTGQNSGSKITDGGGSWAALGTSTAIPINAPGSGNDNQGYYTSTVSDEVFSKSSLVTGQDWFDITGEANGSLAIAVTFTNLTNASAAIYRNRVG